MLTRPVALAPLLIALLGVTSGCINIPYLHPPEFMPGAAEFQQHRAQQFDPYPDTDAGPNVEGSRPEGYATPMPETSRGNPNNRWNQAPLR